MLILFTCSFFTAGTAAAQGYYDDIVRRDSWKLTVGPSFLYSENPGNTVYAYGLSGLASLEYYPNDYLAVTLTSGYEHLIGYSSDGGIHRLPNFSFVPLRPGIKGFVLPKWYLQGEFGGGYANPKLSPDIHFAKTIATAVGYNNPDIGLDISFRYENIHEKNYYISTIGLQIAYSFELWSASSFFGQ